MRDHLKNLLRFPFLPVWLAPFILMAPVILSGGALFWGTPFLQFVPWRAWAWETLLQGHIPLWNPLVGMGAPLIANYQSALFYPPNWLLGLLQSLGGVAAHAWGQGLLVAIHLSWAGLGMAFLIRRLDLGELAQVIGGLAFGLSSYLVSRSGFLSINSAAAWLPWVVLAATWIAGPQRAPGPPAKEPSRFPGWLFLGICFGMQLLAGHAQTAWYTILFTGIWVIAWSIQNGGWRGFFQASTQFVGAMLVAGSLAAIQLFPTAEYLTQSQRAAAVGYDYAVNFSFWPWRFLSLLAPDLFGNPTRGDYWFNAYFWEDAVYIGLLPILLVLFSLAVLNKKKHADQESQKTIPNRRFLLHLLLGVTVVAFLLAMGRYTPVFPFLYHNVPTFSMFQAPTRISILAVFSLIILASLGADRWRRPVRKGLYWSRLATAGAVAVALGAGLAWYALGEVQATFIRATALAGFWGVGIGALTLSAPKTGMSKASPLWSWGVAIWLSMDLISAGWGLNPGLPAAFYDQPINSKGEIEYLGEGKRIYIRQNDEDFIKYKRFILVESFSPEEDWDNYRQVLLPNANMLAGIPSANNFDPLVPGRYARWMEFLTTRAWHELPDWLRMMGVGVIEVVDPDQHYGVRFEKVPSSQRLRWSRCGKYALDENEAWKLATNQIRFRNLPRGGMDETVVLENVPEEQLLPCGTGGEVEITVLHEYANQITLHVNASQPGYLVQADTWYPGWKASVDGKEASLLRADYLFRAVMVPAGDHLVKIYYRPLWFYLGAVLSCLTLIGILITTARIRVAKEPGVG